jgi:predicted nucleotidyltransferase
MAERGVIDLTEQDFAIVRGILEKYVPGRPVFVFGSRANGKAKRRSDLDLAIGGDQPLTMRLLGGLAEAFDESDLPIEVDVVDVNEVSETFRKRIMSEWIELMPASHIARAEVGA